MRRVGVVVLIASLVAGAYGLTGLRVSSSDLFPSHWDARVAPIAAEVAKLRGLTFKHAVSVHFVNDAEFQKMVGIDNQSTGAADRAELDRETGIMRALGLIGGNVDLSKAIDQTQKSGVLAFYSFERKEIFVRGTTLDASHRVTLAHELTHVLQDQWFDLTKREKAASDSESGDSQAFSALVEGDAVRIENKYLAQLSSADRRSYASEQVREGNQFSSGTKGVPPVIPLLFGAPYTFGPIATQILEQDGGNHAVDRALQGAIPSTKIFIDPSTVDAPDVVAPPAVPPGGQRFGTTDTFGAFETYLTLGMRVDPLRALEAADVVTNGRAVSYRRNGVVCYRVALTFANTRGQRFVHAALADWARGRTGTVVAPDGFSTCDQGTRAAAPSSARFTELENLLEVRAELTLVVLKDGAPADAARCGARQFVRQPGLVALLLRIGNRTPTPAEAAQLQSGATALTECRVNTEAGLP